MNKLDFEVYIGSKMISGQNDEIVAVVYPKTYIPHGGYYINGEVKIEGQECFKNLYDLATYFDDWILFVKDVKLIKATIHLNTISLKKIYKGADIVSIIDKIGRHDNWQVIRNFSELN